jgi:excisionase family DNA binding protein
VGNPYDPLLTFEEAGELLGTGPDLPRRLVATGRLDHVQTANGVRVPQSALIRWAVGAARPRARLEPVLYRVCDVTEILHLSRTVVFDLIRTGRLRSVKEGRARLIPASAVRDYLALLEREAA